MFFWRSCFDLFALVKGGPTCWDVIPLHASPVDGPITHSMTDGVFALSIMLVPA